MSNYPPDSYPPQDVPPGGLPPGGFPPGGYPPGPYYGNPYPPPSGGVPSRVIPPAIGLIIVAVINLLGGLYLIANGALSSALPNDQFEQQMANMSPAQKEAFEKAGWSAESIKRLSLGLCIGGGGLAALVSLIIVFGAIRMMALKSFGLAVLASILAAIPCVSCAGCCGIGEGVGIWALVVLLNPEVRAAFR